MKANYTTWTKHTLSSIIILAIHFFANGQCTDANRPINDDPSPTSSHPPTILTLGQFVSGTTCCARGFADDPSYDTPNVQCASNTEEDAVWYRYVTDDEEGFEVTLSQAPSSISGNVTLEILSGISTSPSGSLLTPTSYSCGQLPVAVKVGCFNPGEQVWIKVAGASANCGNFNISIEQINRCPLADFCSQVIDTIYTNPTDVTCGNFTPVTVMGCLDAACPESNLDDCIFKTNPTVWFKIKIDEGTAQIGSSVTTSGNWDPVWAIYGGECDSLKIVNAAAPNEPPITCSNSDSNPLVHTVGRYENQDYYYIAVSGEGLLDDPNFTLNIWTSANCASCIGEDGCIPNAEWQITKRSSARELNDPYFCMGEEVTVCIDYLYDASETGVDWLHGLIPDFGPGWDMVNFNPESIAVSPGNPIWADENDGPCAPFSTEQLPYLCTYTDPLTGRLRLCHTGCQACPCAAPLYSGSALPSGWFWNTNGGEGCLNDCSPSTHYGIGQVVVNIEFCMDLKVRTFADEAEMFENKDLRVNFQTTSDGVTGCWNDPIAECRLDFAQIGPKWEITSRIIDILLSQESDTIIGNKKLNINVSNADGTTNLTIYKDFIPNPNVSGMTRDTFEFGAGIISDSLANLTDSLQIVKYNLYAVDPNDPCSFVSVTLTVFVYPDGSTKKITVYTYNDLNKNGFFDAQTEVPLSLFKVNVPSQNYTYFTNTQGKVDFFTREGNLTLNVIARGTNWVNPDTTLNIMVSDANNVFYVPFVAYVDTSVKIRTQMVIDNFCNGPSHFYFHLRNVGTVDVNGSVTLNYDPRIKTFYSLNEGIIDTISKTITWSDISLSSFEFRNLYVTFKGLQPVGSNDSIRFNFKVKTQDGIDWIYQYAQLITCAYDPNDKSVSPNRPGPEKFIIPGEELTYIIRFQNIGNDSAKQVVITDELDSNLDLLTFSPLYSSHEMNTVLQGNVAVFTFPNIELPDSMTNPLGSQGFVVYTIKPIEAIAENTMISNKADIFFDFNEAIRTNTVINTFVEKLPCPLPAIWVADDTIFVNKSLDVYKWFRCGESSPIAETSTSYFVPEASGQYYCTIDGYFCQSETACVTYVKSSSATDILSRNIKIAPNPGQDYITVDIAQAANSMRLLSFSDTNGKTYQLISNKEGNKITIETQTLINGVYFLTFRDDVGNRVTLKWVKI